MHAEEARELTKKAIVNSQFEQNVNSLMRSWIELIEKNAKLGVSFAVESELESKRNGNFYTAAIWDEVMNKLRDLGFAAGLCKVRSCRKVSW